MNNRKRGLSLRPFPFQLARSFPAAIMAPARSVKDIMPRIFKRAAATEVLPDIYPLMRSNTQRIIGVYIFSEAIDGPLCFLRKSAENAIPDNEHAGMVTVQVFDI